MLLPPADSKHIKERLEEHDEKDKSQDQQRHMDEKATIKQEKQVKIEAPTEEESDDDQKTPQALPTVPSVAVPLFNLDSSNTSTDSETASMPPPPKPTFKPSLMPPPSFPAPNSAQRASQSTSPSLMPPPSRPARSSLGVPAVPGRAPPTLSPAAQARAPPPRIDTPKSSSSKVKLAPGFSPLDWASLAASKNLANVSSFTRVTPSMLKEKNGRKGQDAWSVYNGKVYNITPYAPFHPGGKGELLRAAGKDGTKLFLEVHPWVNWEGMLNSCLVGVLVSESDGEGLDAMD
ncbi:hypothetical protein E4T39_02467 [Aureobasidium subglaciale]|nr:hypothetical protein E4T39_02467 [Aureobasidium subglaciale]